MKLKGGDWFLCACHLDLMSVTFDEARLTQTYEQFLRGKSVTDEPSGFEPRDVADWLFPFQQDITRWALKRGRAALFEDCGLGKTPQQLEWARQVCEHTGGDVLILAPLAVSYQTKT